MIYIADDDKDICYLISQQLNKDGMETKSFPDGQALYEAFMEVPCDLVVTDVMMPILSGFELVKRLREISQVPLIIISANGQEEKRLRGYELGSDDYLTKPFSLKELSYKVRNLLRRHQIQSPTNAGNHYMSASDLILDSQNHEVRIGDQLVETSEKEYQFLKLLLGNKSKAFSREEIIEAIWGYDFVEDTRLLDHVVKRIRKKLIDCDAVFRIDTVWGFGYKVGES